MKSKKMISAFLGVGTRFDGRLSFEGTVHVDGHFRGDISAAGTLVVGESGVIESDIHVSNIIISGEVRGNIVANKSIEIRVPGKVYGNIQAPTVTIHEGVIFEGNCRTCQVKAPEEIKLSIIRPVKTGAFQSEEEEKARISG
ncbi:MAG: polymer-forming cytoskeletal protein [Desulfobacterales bacterium]|nr:polymer-forming cytoskeletal protein [Desulfobacterales bacterium]